MFAATIVVGSQIVLTDATVVGLPIVPTTKVLVTASQIVFAPIAGSLVVLIAAIEGSWIVLTAAIEGSLIVLTTAAIVVGSMMVLDVVCTLVHSQGTLACIPFATLDTLVHDPMHPFPMSLKLSQIPKPFATLVTAIRLQNLMNLTQMLTQVALRGEALPTASGAHAVGTDPLLGFS